jgi:hypothetical protein
MAIRGVPLLVGLAAGVTRWRPLIDAVPSPRPAAEPVVIEARDGRCLWAGLVAAGALAPVLLGRNDDLLVAGDPFRAAPGIRP